MAARGIRNNNPGNIEDGPFARSLPGYVGGDGRFAVFETPEAGAGAMDRLLANYGNKGINTVAGVIQRWAPAADNNPTSAYAAYVARKLDGDPTAVVDLSNPAVRQAIASGIHEFENGTGQGGPVPPKGPVPAPQAPQQPPASIGEVFTGFGGLPPELLTVPRRQAQLPEPVEPGPLDPAFAPRAPQLKRMAVSRGFMSPT